MIFTAFMDRLLCPDAPPPRHLTQSIALEESALPGLLRTSVTIIGAFVAAFIVWASFTRIDEVATAQGQVIPSGHVQVVQHLEGGIVKEILVNDGDLVEAGQPLIRLDDIGTGADLGQVRARQQALQLQAARLKSFAGTAEGKDEPLTGEEQKILASMEDARTSQSNMARDQIAQKRNELKAAAATRQALQKNVALMEKENTIKQNLAQKGYGSQLMALDSERQLNQMKGQLQEAINQEGRANEAVHEAENHLAAVNADMKQQAMKSLGDVEAQLAEVTQNLEKLEHTEDRTVITAPVRGVVKGLAVHTVGAVAEQGKVLLEVVPLDVEMMVEAMVMPNDVGHLKPGQPVKVKISAFDSSRYGSIAGKLANVSATTFQTPDGKSFYKAQIKLAQAYVGKDPHNLILPGMMVQADIITGDKTVLQYLLKPIHSAVEGAFHEY